ncbi:MAG TPA: hypothetical protein VM889_14315 [Candidatus Thermoplasmatota archaeon]|nr:hypothetical protein [Candidatus Thermoplasmatota archaeon]
MLEPFLRPRAGQVFHGLGAAAFGLAALMDSGVVTRYGYLPMNLAAPPIAAFFFLRFVGHSVAVHRERDSMAWGWRIASWAALLVVFFFFGLIADGPGLLALGAYVALDAAGALSKRRPGARRRLRIPIPRIPLPGREFLVALGALALLGAFHVVVASRFPYAVLLDWGFACILAGAFAWRGLLAPGKAPPASARPPPGHRVHARTERLLPDPAARAIEASFAKFLADGDLEGVLAAARRAARFASLPERDMPDLEREVREAVARAGTTREDDLRAAVDAIVRRLETPRSTPVIP